MEQLISGLTAIILGVGSLIVDLLDVALVLGKGGAGVELAAVAGLEVPAEIP